MATKKKTHNQEALMKELAQIDNQGEMSQETLAEINGGATKLPIDILPTLGLWVDPIDPKPINPFEVA